MWYRQATDEYVKDGQQFSVEGVSYPSNWLEHASAEEIARLGLTPVLVVGERGDDRYYDNAERLVGGALTIAATRKDAVTIKAIMWTDIKAERDRRADQGGYMVGDYWFRSDQKSRNQQLGLVLLGANIPADVPWRTMDGRVVVMTQELAARILAAGAASDITIFAAAEAHKAAMEASPTPETYAFSSGWPKVFGE